MKLINPTATSLKIAIHPIRTLLLVLVSVCLVSACDSSDSSSVIADAPLFSGTISTPRGIAQRSISLKSPDGNFSEAAVDEFGNFIPQPAATGDRFLMRADLGNDNFLYSIAHLTDETENRQNIHSYTDLVARTWFADLGLDINSVFASRAGIDNFPDVDGINTIDANIQAIVSDVLQVYGLSDVSLSNSAYEKNDTGIDRFLNENPVIIRDNRATIIVNDPLTNLQATAVNRVQLNTSFGVTDITPPEQPQALRALGSEISGTDATSRENAIVLAWSIASDNIGVARYDIFRDNELIGSTPFPFFRDPNIESDTSYSYTVITVDESGNRSIPSVQATGMALAETDTTPPAIPSSATLIGNTDSIDVFWTHSDISDLARFEVTRTGGDGILVREVTTARLSDIVVASGTEYCYTIVAVDASGNRSDINPRACMTTSGSAVNTQSTTLLPTVIEMAQTSISGSEGSVVSAFVNRLGNGIGEVSIDYTVMPGTATPEDDYFALNGTLFWPNGDIVARQIDISLIPDGIVEEAETLTVVLTSSSTDVVVTNAVTTVTIIDID